MISTTVKTQPQIFLSFARADHELAERIGTIFQKAGIKVYRMDQMGIRGEYSEAVRKALLRSDAVVVALSSIPRQQDFPASVLFEIGAAMGAEKDIYVVVEEPTAKLPFSVRHLEILPVSRVNEIADKLCVGS